MLKFSIPAAPKNVVAREVICRKDNMIVTADTVDLTVKELTYPQLSAGDKASITVTDINPDGTRGASTVKELTA